MTFGEKVRQARIALDLSQTELAAKTGISERSLYTYEQMGTMPRMGNVKKIAEALCVSVGYLMDEEEDDREKDIDKDIFLANVKNEYGIKGAKEASEVLTRASALFAGGELDEEAKDLFFRSIMEVYLDSKEEARAKFAPRQRKSRRKKD
ncbi:MAG: helix-turn-helix transcriptional regulator [Clostridia bacterium]|nr:helix-turn-helix transcriptional regulator [Clostridia bacterium]